MTMKNVLPLHREKFIHLSQEPQPKPNSHSGTLKNKEKVNDVLIWSEYNKATLLLPLGFSNICEREEGKRENIK